MRRAEFEHVIAAAANVTGQDEFVVIGSQAILGTHPDAPETMLMSLEVDIYPRDRPELADEIDGALGDGSQFHVTFGYYAHGRSRDGQGSGRLGAAAGAGRGTAPGELGSRAGGMVPGRR